MCGDKKGKIAVSLFGVGCGIDDIVGKAGIASTDKNACKHSSGDDGSLILSKKEKGLPDGIADSANEQNPFGRYIITELAPKGGKQKIHGHHGSQCNAEHRAVQISFYDERRGYWMSIIGSKIEDDEDRKKQIYFFVFHGSLSDKLILFLL